MTAPGSQNATRCANCGASGAGDFCSECVEHRATDSNNHCLSSNQAIPESAQLIPGKDEELTLDRIRHADGEFWSSGEAVRFTIIPEDEHWVENPKHLDRARKILFKKLKGLFLLPARVKLESSGGQLIISVDLYGVVERKPRTVGLHARSFNNFFPMSSQSTGRAFEKTVLDALNLTLSGLQKTGCFPIRKARWVAGRDLSIRREAKERLEQIEARAKRLRSTFQLLFIFALLLLVGGGIVAAVSEDSIHHWSAVAACYGVPLLAFAALSAFSARNAEADAQELRNQQVLEELTSETNRDEWRAQKLFQTHNEQIKRYYDQALLQRGLIFGAGTLCIIAGFTIIGIAFYLLQNLQLDSHGKIIIAALGAVGGILGNFIAVIHLRMFSETLTSIGGFHDRLVSTHHLHFANFLTSKITNKTLADEALREMAAAVAQHDGIGSKMENNQDNSTQKVPARSDDRRLDMTRRRILPVRR